MKTYPPTLALVGGSWQTVRGVRRWVPNPPKSRRGGSVARPENIVPPDSPLANLIACPCGAKAIDVCRSKNGNRLSTEHAARTMTRICPCGAKPKRRGMYCARCAHARNRTSHRENRRRTRAAEKAAA